MKILLAFFFGLSSYILIGQHLQKEGEEFSHHCFFEEKSVSWALSLPYSFHIESFGINTRVYYNLGEKICFGPEFSYFSHKDDNIYDFNFIIHYILETKITGIYPLIGMNYTAEEEGHHSENAFGVVAGGGLHRNFKKITFFAEYAHVFSDLEDEFITVGFMLTFK